MLFVFWLSSPFLWSVTSFVPKPHLTRPAQAYIFFCSLFSHLVCMVLQWLILCTWRPCVTTVITWIFETSQKLSALYVVLEHKLWLSKCLEISISWAFGFSEVRSNPSVFSWAEQERRVYADLLLMSSPHFSCTVTPFFGKGTSLQVEVLAGAPHFGNLWRPFGEKAF